MPVISERSGSERGDQSMLMPGHDKTDAFRAITLAIAGIVAMDFLAYWWLVNQA